MFILIKLKNELYLQIRYSWYLCDAAYLSTLLHFDLKVLITLQVLNETQKDLIISLVVFLQGLNCFHKSQRSGTVFFIMHFENDVLQKSAWLLFIFLVKLNILESIAFQSAFYLVDRLEVLIKRQ